MEVASARIVNLKEKVSKGHFEHTNENERIDKYTLSDQLPARLATLQLHSMQPTFSIRKVSASDKGTILSFLRRFFFRDEPMNQAVQLLPTPEARCSELEQYATSSLEDNVSVAVFANDGEMIGVVLNGVAKRQEGDHEDKSSQCPDEKFSRILQVLAHLEREAKVWDQLPSSVTSVIEVRIASTHPDWRGRGLMKALCDETEKIAKKIGAAAIRIDTTSAYSAAAAERLGYKKVYSVLYKDLPYAPQPEPPHTEARVYLKQL